MLAQAKNLVIVVERSTDILGGALVFHGTRVPFQTFIDYLKAGDNLDDFLDDFPTVSREQVWQALEIVQETLMRESNASLIR
jgi:uncharacterized protein (DUF433 family)